MTASPYDAPERTPNRAEQTTIWRDGEVIRRDGWGRLTTRPSVPSLPESPHPTSTQVPHQS